MSTQPKYPSALSSALGHAHYYSTLPERIHSALLLTLAPYFALPTTHRVLELSSGNGTHAVVYSQAFPSLDITPSEADAFGVGEIRESVEKANAGRRLASGGVREGVVLDFGEKEGWEELERSVESEAKFDLVVGSNFLHMAEWPRCAVAVFARVRQLVDPSHGRMAIYGPYRPNATEYFSESDEKFEATIRARPGGAGFGLRSIEDLEKMAKENGWRLERQVPMPAGNFVLVFAVEGAAAMEIE